MTPKGQYKIKFILYRKDRIKKITTRLKTLIIRKNMGWCNDYRSKQYNKLIYLPFKYNYEKLYRTDNAYDIILVLNYNMNPIKKKKRKRHFFTCRKEKL